MRRWSIHAGRYIHREILTNQFSVRVQRGKDVHCAVLSTSNGSEADLHCRGWAWGVASARVESRALFPRSWLLFREPVPGVNVTIEQLSPVMPNCYSDTSLPTSVFTVSIENLNPEVELDVSVMMTMQNSDGTEDDADGGYVHSPFSVPTKLYGPSDTSNTTTGICMARHRKLKDQHRPTIRKPMDQGSMSMATTNDMNDTISLCSMFSTNAKVNGLSDGSDLWRVFVENGDIDGCNFLGISPPATAVASAVCRRGKVLPQQRKEFVFSLSWDHPVARFGIDRILPKFYTRFFGRSGLASPSIAIYSLAHYRQWRQVIVEWQYPINSNENLPMYYRHMLFNELYYVVDGGSIWLDTTDGVDNETESIINTGVCRNCPCTLKELNSSISAQLACLEDWVEGIQLKALDIAAANCSGNSKFVGQFLYLEGHEYLMYVHTCNSLKVMSLLVEYLFYL